MTKNFTDHAFHAITNNGARSATASYCHPQARGLVTRCHDQREVSGANTSAVGKHAGKLSATRKTCRAWKATWRCV